MRFRAKLHTQVSRHPRTEPPKEWRVLRAVLGRQLVGISEEDELVCFSLYATAHADKLAPEFRAFDWALAQALGLALFDPSPPNSEYSIVCVLSHDWWDDDAWGP